MSQNDPIYNIGAVARITDIPAATLRVWERRYGFPDTARTEGGHRLYSENDVRRLEWVKRKIDEGMQTRQAVKALSALEESGVFPAAVADTLSPLPSLEMLDSDVASDSYVEVLQKRLLDTLLIRNLDEADRIFDEALALYAPEDVMLHLIRPVMSDIGMRWEDGDVSIGTEHLTTQYLRERLLIWLRTGPPVFAVGPTVLACAPGEYHEGGLMILGALLRRRRWPVAYLGQSIPLPDVAKFVREVQPLALVFSAMTEDAAEALTPWPQWLPEVQKNGHPIVAFGGRVFNLRPEWQSRVPGTFLGGTLVEGVETLERMLRRIRSPLE